MIFPCERGDHYMRAELIPTGGFVLVCARCGHVGLSTADINQR